MSSALRGAPLPNTAIEIAHVETVLVAPADTGPHGCGVPVPGLLTLPIHWATRDAVAMANPAAIGPDGTVRLRCYLPGELTDRKQHLAYP